jgi:hypothetical protein
MWQWAVELRVEEPKSGVYPIGALPTAAAMRYFIKLEEASMQVSSIINVASRVAYVMNNVSVYCLDLFGFWHNRNDKLQKCAY